MREISEAVWRLIKNAWLPYRDPGGRFGEDECGTCVNCRLRLALRVSRRKQEKSKKVR